jgi:hypothetical protein
LFYSSSPSPLNFRVFLLIALSQKQAQAALI